MWAPLTPNPPRKSLKKILLSSPSQEVLRFLALPNPSATEDPRSRIHILTPKTRHHRSLSRTHLPQQSLPLQPLATSKTPLPNRDCFIRKKVNQASWKKTEVKFRSEKLKIRDSDDRITSSLCSSQSSETAEEPKRLDMTFGAGGFWSCIKV